MNHRIDPNFAAGIRPGRDAAKERPNPTGGGKNETDFKTLLDEARNEQVRFSNHAVQRMERRNISLSRDDIGLLREGFRRAEEKGSKESLLLMDRTAFVINVPDRTVITAVDQENMKEKTFTNIDSAILLSRK